MAGDKEQFKMKVFGITGFARSGKDTAAAYMVKEHGYTRLAFADTIRDVLYALNPIVDKDYIGKLRVQDIVNKAGWDVAKVEFPEVRELLQRLGVEAGREILGKTIWTDTVFKKASALGCNVVISDVRFPDEVEAVRSLGGKVIRINRPGVAPVNDHITDRRLPDILIDFEVSNDGSIQDLNEKIKQIITQ